MDGNFQLKRKSQKNDHVDEFDNQGVFMPCPVEKALWGSSDEVELFVTPKEVDKDVSCFLRHELNLTLFFFCYLF